MALTWQEGYETLTVTSYSSENKQIEWSKEHNICLWDVVEWKYEFEQNE